MTKTKTKTKQSDNGALERAKKEMEAPPPEEQPRVTPEDAQETVIRQMNECGMELEEVCKRHGFMIVSQIVSDIEPVGQFRDRGMVQARWTLVRRPSE